MFNIKGALLASTGFPATWEKRMSAPERVDLMGNAQALVTAGKLPVADGLTLVQTFHSDTDRHVVTSALDVALEPRDHLVSQPLEANYQRFLQKNFDARARELGWMEQDGEPDDTTPIAA